MYIDDFRWYNTEGENKRVNDCKRTAVLSKNVEQILISTKLSDNIWCKICYIFYVISSISFTRINDMFNNMRKHAYIMNNKQVKYFEVF